MALPPLCVPGQDCMTAFWIGVSTISFMGGVLFGVRLVKYLLDRQWRKLRKQGPGIER